QPRPSSAGGGVPGVPASLFPAPPAPPPPAPPAPAAPASGLGPPSVAPPSPAPPSTHTPGLSTRDENGVLVMLENDVVPNEMLSMSQPASPPPASVPMRNRIFTILPASLVPKFSDTLT